LVTNEWSPRPVEATSRLQSFVRWINPTEPSEPQVDNPLCPKVGKWSKQLSKRPFFHPFVYGFLLFSCLTLLALFWMNSFAAVTPEGSVQSVGCGDSFWNYDGCGVNGTNCLPFESDWMAMRCDALCSKYNNGWKAIGTNVYRADSQICHAATHAGVIGQMGGCFLIRASGPQFFFNGSDANGVSSIPWTTYFPKSFEFKECTSTFCTPLQLVILATFLIFGFILLLLRVPKWLFFAFIVHVGWWYIGFSGTKDSPHGDLWINFVMSTMLPSFAFAYVMYSVGNKAIFGPDFPIDNFLFYLLPTVILIHMNYITFILDFDLTPQSLSSLTLPAIICIVLLVIGAICIGIPQVYFLWKAGKLFKYLLFYLLLMITTVFVAFPIRHRFGFHFHHYMIGLLLWPITAFNSRPSALLQGILLGLFINGAARWGFGSLFDIYSIEGPSPPTQVFFESRLNNTVTLSWENICQAYSLRMNDFEVYRGIHSQAVITLPNTDLDLLYYFCVRCLQDGILGSDCSNVLTVSSH